MKKHLTIVSLILCVSTTHAQLDSNFFELGVNSIRLLQFNRSSQISSDFWSPYMLTLEKKFGKVGIRTGFGFSSSTHTELPSKNNGNAEFRNDTNSFDMRLGIVFYARLGNKWSLKYGLDGTYASAKREYNTIIMQGISRIESVHAFKRSETGAGIFVFPQYHITQRISIGTELAVAFAGIKASEDVSSSSTDQSVNLEDYNKNLENEGTFFGIRPPSALYVIMRF